MKGLSSCAHKINSFYTKWENLGLKITLILISLQVIHLIWLSHWVLFHQSIDAIPNIVFVSIDYLEIPALISGIVFYLTNRNYLYLSFLAVQILHIVWISDEFVVRSFLFQNVGILTAVAIAIDFLELIVIRDLYYRIRARK